MARLGDTATPDPGVATPAATPPPDARDQAPQTETPPAETVPSTEKPGFVPTQRHEAAVKNAREVGRTDAEKAFQQQYGTHIAFGERFEADPVGSTLQAINGLSQHPEFGPQIVSALARVLGSRRQSAQTETDQEPQADLQSPDGTQVYSAERLAQIRAYDRQQILKEVDQRLAPVLTREQQTVAQERKAQGERNSMARMSKVLEPYRALPEFKENQKAISAKAMEYLQAGHGAETALGLAVTHVLREVVLPARTAKSQEQLMATAVAKATGSTSTPGAAPASPAGRPQNFEDAFKGIRA